MTSSLGKGKKLIAMLEVIALRTGGTHTLKIKMNLFILKNLVVLLSHLVRFRAVKNITKLNLKQ